MATCLFCQIVGGQIPAEFIYKDDLLVVFKDINPKTKIHLLIVPKKHIDSINHLTDQDKDLISYMILMAKKIAKDQGVAESGYKLLFNVGRGGGQIIDHLHLHLMGGGESRG